MSKKSTRRAFIEKSAGAVTALGTIGLSACSESSKTEQGPYIIFNKKYRWKMTTTWPPNFPILGESCKMLAKWVREMSGGRMEITVFGGGELIPALEGFDAVSNGAVEMNNGSAYYWAGKIPAAPFFSAVPFGMNAQQVSAWMSSGGGQALWEEAYAPHNLLPFMCGNTGVQMGGWFNKEINTLADLKGLKMRIPGLGGKVLARVGGSPVTVAGGEIYTNLERGVLDATEWIGPYHDYIMGFPQIAKYYYYPGWHEPGPIMEMIVNKDKFLALPTDLQEILRSAFARMDRWMMAEFDAKNAEYLQKIVTENVVDLRAFPKAVIAGLRQATNETIADHISSDPQSKRVFEHYQRFKKTINKWSDISERKYYEDL